MHILPLLAAAMAAVGVSGSEGNEGLLSRDDASAFVQLHVPKSDCEGSDLEPENARDILRTAETSHEATREHGGARTPTGIGTDNIFCFAMVAPWEETIPNSLEQMRMCGGHAMFSNYSDEDSNIFTLFSGPLEVNRVDGHPNNTFRMVKVWEHIARIAKRSVNSHYDWFVKVDADAFFRPQHLPRLVRGLNPLEAIAIGSEGRCRGALEVVSGGAIRSIAPFFHIPANPDPKTHEWAEDLWLGKAMVRAGGTVVNAPSHDSCEAFLTSYHNIGLLPYVYDHSGHPLPDLLGGASLNITSKKQKWCVSKDIVAIHPVKDPKKYREFQLLDRPTE